MIKERYMGEWMERIQHTQKVMETKDYLCTDNEVMKSMECLVGTRDFIS